MEIIRIYSWKHLQENLYKELYVIYEKSFPESERRNFEEFFSLVNNNAFGFYYLLQDNELLGFYTQWIFSNFYYIEHLAINEQYRCKGFGSQLTGLIVSTSPKLLVIEVERPGDPGSDRRIKFYLRTGFNLCDFDYIQPPYCYGKSPVPMYLMTYPNVPDYNEYLKIRETLYREVYHNIYSLRMNKQR